MVEFIFEFEGQTIVLPQTPSNHDISRDGNNEKVEIVGLGEIIIPREPKLATFSISSFFPFWSYESGNTTEASMTPMEYVEFFERARLSKKYLKFTTTGLNQESMLVVIDNFNYEKRGGEHEDVYYNLDLTEYIPYGASTIELREDNEDAIQPIPPQRSEENKPVVGRTYTVLKGDSLWAIAKAKSGNGSNYMELYELNKEVIGNSPNRIQIGTVLNIPESWIS